MNAAASRHPAIPITRSEAQSLEITAWDRIAPSRVRDLDLGRDPSFRFVLSPGVSTLVPQTAISVLDIGCGVGRFTQELARPDRKVVAIDPSPVSAALSKQHLRAFANIEVLNQTVREYGSDRYAIHDAGVALMVLQDITDLDDFLRNAAKVLRRNASFVGAITHPRHWPQYWGYDKAPWFEYDKEFFIRSIFRTSLTETDIATLHVHRPIRMYRTAFHNAGFTNIESWEPLMDVRAQRIAGVSWTRPHFWFFRAIRK